MGTLATLEGRDVVTIEPWHDPVVESLGHDPRSLYVETFWLPVLGPSSILLLRRLATCLEAAGGGCAINLAETARALGLGERSGRNAPLLRTFARTVDFGMARVTAPGELAVRTTLPPLARRHLLRLPEGLRAEHALLEEPAAADLPAGDSTLRRGRQLALSLVDLGEDEEGAARQLLRWRFHPAVARDCARWAIAARTDSGSPSEAGNLA